MQRFFVCRDGKKLAETKKLFAKVKLNWEWLIIQDFGPVEDQDARIIEYTGVLITWICGRPE